MKNHIVTLALVGVLLLSPLPMMSAEKLSSADKKQIETINKELNKLMIVSVRRQVLPNLFFLEKVIKLLS